MERVKSAVKPLGLYALALLIPCVCVVAVFYILGMYPFGEANLLAWDLQITYTYFYEWFRSVLHGDANLFYSFSKSLGGNMLPGWSCLLSSPLCLTIFFFGDNPVIFVTFMVVTKFGLAGLTSLFYLRRRFALPDALSLCLSISYSMMLFMTAQAANPMWMDTVIMLPLVMYGTYCVINDGRVTLFGVSLLLSIIFNFYNGYMVCLFSVLFYLYESYLASPGSTRVRLGFMVNPARFSIAYTLAITSSFIVLVPTALGLMAGKGSVPDGFMTLATRFDLFDLPRSLFLGIYEKEYLPQLYTGTLALVCLVWFMANEQVPVRERRAAALFLTVLTLSMWFVVGDRIWLGFRDGHSFYCRFTFTTSTILITIAARSLETLGQADTRKLALSAGAVACTATVILLDGYYVRLRYYLATIALCAVLPLGLTLHSKAKGFLARLGLAALLLSAVSCEAGLSWYGVESFRVNAENNPLCGYGRYDSYFGQGRDIVSLVEALPENQDGAYRFEKTFNFMTPMTRLAQNDTMAFGYRGIALYDSAYDSRVQKVLHKLGYTPDVEVRISYSEAMVVADSILGVKYVMSDACPPGYVKHDIDATWEGHSLYENPYALPLGFQCSPMILDGIVEDGDPFSYQNQFLSSLCGTEDDYLVKVEPRLSHIDDDEVLWMVDAPDDATLYGYIQSDELRWLNLYVNGDYRSEYLSLWSQGVFVIPPARLGGERTVALRGAIPQSVADVELHVAYLDPLSLQSAIDQLRAQPLEFDAFDDGFVRATFQAEQDCLIFTSIPYDPGWAISINGEAVTPLIVDDAFIAIPAKQGMNVIEMSYLPPGLAFGAVVSALSLILFAAFGCYFRQKPVIVVDEGRFGPHQA